MNRYVVRLDSRAALQEARSGGKGAGLAKLMRSGFAVPPGFVITSTAFHDFLASLGIGILGEKRDWAQGDLERIRELLTFCEIPARLRRHVLRAYRRLGGTVAVRSSMVGEDAAQISFAGQLDTKLSVEGAMAVLDAVRQCWASMFNWRLFKYLSEHEALSPEAILNRFSVAVVVQRMVAARAAGVSFSADPLTGQRCVVIEAVRGLGDGLVQGWVEPDRYVVDARGALSEEIVVSPVGPVLSRAGIDRLADIVRAAARLMRTPQDVEWAWDGRRFFLLQSRPITTLAGKHVYSNAMVSDMAPGLIKPMVYSTNTVGMARNVLGRIFTELIGPNDVDFTSLVKLIHSRIYTDVTLLGDLFERLGLPVNFFEMVSRDERAEQRRPSLRPKNLRAGLRLLRFARRQARSAPEISGFVEGHDDALGAYRRADWSSLPPAALLAHLDRLVTIHGDTQWYVFVAAINMSVRNRILAHWVTQRVPDVVPSDLIRGLVGLKALEPNTRLRALADRAGALGEGVCRLLVEEDDAIVRATLSGVDGGPELIQRVDGFLEKCGFLSACGTDFTIAPWQETPSLIWHAIGRAATAPPGVPQKDVVAARQEARRRARSRLRWHQRLFFDRLLASTTTFIDLRERTSLLMSRDAYQMRRLLLALGAHLVAWGVLDQSDDIFYLTYDEARRAVDGRRTSRSARELVRERRETLAADAQIELPDFICGDTVMPQPIVPVDGQGCLVGISGSSGVAQGSARVVLDPVSAPSQLDRSHILVVPFTDVGWTPLLSGVAGIVAETGGQLSHTSIVAREYGLPAVVNVKKATHLIRDGQQVTVDGNNGKVYLG
jgi:phosphohistidine swiveling domain-containing protein